MVENKGKAAQIFGLNQFRQVVIVNEDYLQADDEEEYIVSLRLSPARASRCSCWFTATNGTRPQLRL